MKKLSQSSPRWLRLEARPSGAVAKIVPRQNCRRTHMDHGTSVARPVVRRSVDTPAALGFNRTRSHGPDRPDPHGYHDHRTALEVLPRALSAVFRVAPLPGFTGLVLARLRRDGRPYKARSADRTALRAFWTTRRVPAIAA